MIRDTGKLVFSSLLGNRSPYYVWYTAVNSPSVEVWGCRLRNPGRLCAHGNMSHRGRTQTQAALKLMLLWPRTENGRDETREDVDTPREIRDYCAVAFLFV